MFEPSFLVYQLNTLSLIQSKLQKDKPLKDRTKWNQSRLRTFLKLWTTKARFGPRLMVQQLEFYENKHVFDHNKNAFVPMIYVVYGSMAMKIYQFFLHTLTAFIREFNRQLKWNKKDLYHLLI